jgi:hypothetical protein
VGLAVFPWLTITFKEAFDMYDTERAGITPKSWTAERHRGVLHLGKRWYVVTADIDEAGKARGVRLDGPYADHETAETKVEKQGSQRGQRRVPRGKSIE